MAPKEREEWIEMQIRLGGLSRAEAGFALAIELGEVDGDVTGVDGGDDPRDGDSGS